MWRWILSGADGKAAANLAKHGVSFEEAASVFRDQLGRITPDLRHSTGEERFVLLGWSQRQLLMAVMYTERGPAVGTISGSRSLRL